MNIFKRIYYFLIDLYELPKNIKQLIKEHEYYKKEYLNLISEYDRLQDKFNVLLVNHTKIMNDLT